jgi:SLA1 Homology Domain 1 (SHD1) protein
MRFRVQLIQLAIVLSAASNVCFARTWTDKTGKYKIDADLIAFNDKSVVLQRADHELGMVAIDELSQEDQKYLKSKAAADESQKILGKQQTWKLANGMQLVGRVVGYARKQITLERQRGKIYVNDRVFENLPPIYQIVVPKIVANVEHLQRDDRSAVEDWLVANKGRPQTVAFDGVMMELDNGDEYCVPLFLFSPEDQRMLKPGWDAWAAAAENDQQKYDRQSEQSFMLQSLAAARQRDAQVNRLVAQMQLNTAVLGGATSLWEVTLYPQRAGRPIWVTEAGENSAQAIERARQQYPGYAVGPVRKVAGY